MKILKMFVIASLVTSMAHAQIASRLMGRAKDLGKSAVTRADGGPGTVMAIADAGDSRTVLIVLDTSVQRRAVCYAIPAHEQRRFHRRVEVGSTFVAVRFLPNPIEIGELTCHTLRNWTAKRKGNPLRREFLVGGQGYRAHVLSMIFRASPVAARHFFPTGAELLPATADLAQIVDLYESFGFDMSGLLNAIDEF